MSFSQLVILPSFFFDCSGIEYLPELIFLFSGLHRYIDIITGHFPSSLFIFPFSGKPGREVRERRKVVGRGV